MKIGVVFPGYSSQKIGMAKELYDQSRQVQELFETAGNCLPINFIKLCFASSDAELAKVEHAWPALLLVGRALFSLLTEHGLKPSLYVGYNIGLYTAACAAGSLTLPDGLYLLAKYAEIYNAFLKEHAYECRKITGVSVDDVNSLCERYAQEQERSYVSTFDQAKACRVVGIAGALDKLSQELERFKEVGIEPDSLGHELHCPLAQLCAEQFAVYMPKIDVKQAAMPIVLSTKPTETVDGGEIHTELVERITKPIRWDRSVRTLRTMDAIIQVGPGTSFIPSLEQEFSPIPVFPLTSFSDLEHIKRKLEPEKDHSDSKDISDGSEDNQRTRE